MKWHELERRIIQRGLQPNDARELIWTCTEQGLLQIIEPAAMVEDQLLSGDIPNGLIISHIRRVLVEGPVATLPVSSNSNLTTTIDAFRYIIAIAIKDLVIVSPYLDDGGVTKLEEPIKEAIKRGVDIKVLTRETHRKQQTRTRGLVRLCQLAGIQLEVRDYHTQSEGLSHYTSVHAKLLLADETVGYVGSAEIRGNALEKNFELGTIIWDARAATAKQIYSAVWEIARIVPTSEII